MGQLMEGKRPGKKKIKIGWVVVALLLLGLPTYAIATGNIYGKEPFIRILQGEKEVGNSFLVGKKPNFNFVVGNKKGGICHVNVLVTQGDLQATLINQEDLSKSHGKFETTLAAQNVELINFAEAPVQLVATVSSCSLLKRQTTVKFTGNLDLTPPRISLTSSQHYINQGGADLATYTATEGTADSGVRIGNYEFTGHKKPGSASDFFAFFVYSYDIPTGTPIEIYARDMAGNESTTSLPIAKFFPKEFRKRDLPIDDNFINTKVADIIANTHEITNTGDPLKNYLMVNRDLRKTNASFLMTLSHKSEETFFWKDAFKPLMNAAIEASFADYRSYIYNGQKVDEQVHLGFDMAVTEHYPITASNRGKVLFAGYLGIYGNTVILDHGYGLTTLYGHLNSIDVAEGEMVESNQKVGNSGATGLAGGDHLHFSMLIDGVQTNPVEFWDQHWIDDHVYLRLPKDLF